MNSKDAAAMTSAQRMALQKSVKRKQDVEAARNAGVYCTYVREESAFDKELTVYAARRRGRHHYSDQKPCQDYCLTESTQYAQVLVDADGVSRCERSNLGARFACESVLECVREAEKHYTDENTFVDALCSYEFRRQIVHTWLKKVKADVAADVITGNDIRLYGTTLLFAVITENWIVAGNLGDGQVLVFNSVEGLKLRKHEPKDNSVTRALCDYTCAEESFLVEKFSRDWFSGVLLSTDGIYDNLSSGHLSFYFYARKLVERFEAAGEPLQPFCFEEEGQPLDLWASFTSDDCSIVLAVDHSPVLEDAILINSAVKDRFPRMFLSGRCGDVSVYKVFDGTRTNLVTVRAQEPETAAVEIPETIEVRMPEETWTEHGYLFNVYPIAQEERMDSVEELFCKEKLKQRSEAKYGVDGSKMAMRYCYWFDNCRDSLARAGLFFSECAHMTSFYVSQSGKNPRLVLFPEAISLCAVPTYIPEMFRCHLGRLTCGKRSRPLFHPGFVNVGNELYFSTPDKNGKLVRFCRVLLEEQTFYLKNCGEKSWQMSDESVIPPDGKISIAEDVRFEVEDPAGTIITVNYYGRKHYD